jgi:hypothetical protein
LPSHQTAAPTPTISTTTAAAVATTGPRLRRGFSTGRSGGIACGTVGPWPA